MLSLAICTGVSVVSNGMKYLSQGLVQRKESGLASLCWTPESKIGSCWWGTMQSQEGKRHNPVPRLLSQDPHTAGYCGHSSWVSGDSGLSISMRTPGSIPPAGPGFLGGALLQSHYAHWYPRLWDECYCATPWEAEARKDE